MEKEGKLHQGHWKRFREKALKVDTAKFSDKEMLELTLQYVFSRGDVNEIASRLLLEFKTFDKVLNASISELTKVKGVGVSVAEKIVLLPKIINFYNVSNAKSQKKFITCSKECTELARQFLSGLNFERLYMFCLNKTGQVIKEVVLGDGEESFVSFSLNEILVKATESKASSVVFAHNHPNGKVTPSISDNDFTKRVTQILYLSGIRVLEHIIIGANGLYYSYANYGFIEKFIEDVKKL